MILADKIILLRKRKGWSQEELAEQLGVTRQSVSKWEGAQSVPDIQKIIQMSEIFGVTTDYLLKDEIEDTKTEDGEIINRKESEDNSEGLRVLTMNEASEYLRLRREAAPKMAGATLLCVLSPIALLMLSALSCSVHSVNALSSLCRKIWLLGSDYVCCCFWLRLRW